MVYYDCIVPAGRQGDICLFKSVWCAGWYRREFWRIGRGSWLSRHTILAGILFWAFVLGPLIGVLRPEMDLLYLFYAVPII